MPVRQNAFSHESRNAAREARLKLAEEARIDAAYFHGVHRIPSTDPRLSPHLIAYYEKLKSEGETILVMKNREGVEIETPSVEQIERFCRHHNIKFLDHEFIPSDEILFKRDDPKDELPVDKHHPVVWYRATRLFEKPQLFVGNISPSDIKQGLLGDCWLMCSLAAIAEFPSLVKDCFVGEEDRSSPEGVYQVRFFKEGVEEICQLDDHIPCIETGTGTPCPIYSRADGPELWVVLLEKAFAKYNGSYAAVAAGKPFEALIDLTGCPYYEYRFSDVIIKKKIENKSLFENILSFDKSKYVMSAHTSGKDTQSTSSDKKDGPPSGIVPGHAYTLCSAVKLRNGTRLVQLRNPWGKFEWSGEWCDNDKAHWTPEIVQEMIGYGFPVKNVDDGKFWMTFEDMTTFYIGINVVLTEKWNVFRETFWMRLGDVGKYGMKSSLFKLTVHEPGKFFFSVHQHDRRVIGSKPLFDFGVTVLKPIKNAFYEDDFELVVSTGNSVERQIQCEIDDLQPGEYWIVPTSTGTKLKQFKAADEFDGKTPTLRRSAGINVHSLANFTCVHLSATPEIKMLVRERAIEEPVVSQAAESKDIYGDGSLICSSLRCGYAGRSYAVKNNTNDSKYPRKIFWEVTMDLTKSTNIISSTGSLTCNVIVAPGQTEIVAHVFPEGENGTFTLSSGRTQRKLSDDELNDYLTKNPLIANRLFSEGILTNPKWGMVTVPVDA